ncbi:hypothetical protein ACLB2K_044177 [Fragaria x ananassa]
MRGDGTYIQSGGKQRLDSPHEKLFILNEAIVSVTTHRRIVTRAPLTGSFSAKRQVKRLALNARPFTPTYAPPGGYAINTLTPPPTQVSNSMPLFNSRITSIGRKQATTAKENFNSRIKSIGRKQATTAKANFNSRITSIGRKQATTAKENFNSRITSIGRKQATTAKETLHYRITTNGRNQATTVS